MSPVSTPESQLEDHLVATLVELKYEYREDVRDRAALEQNFREYVAQLVEHGQQFLIIGNVNAITYKEVFKLLKEDKLWLGVGFNAGNAYFEIPKENVRAFAFGGYDQNSEADGLT